MRRVGSRFGVTGGWGRLRSAYVLSVAFCALSTSICGAALSNPAAVVGLKVEITEAVFESALFTQDFASIASAGDGYFLVWSDYRNRGFSGGPDIYGTRISRTGEVLDPRGLPVAIGDAAEGRPVVGGNGRSYLVVWHKHTMLFDPDNPSQVSPVNQLEARRFSVRGTSLDAEPIVISEETPLNYFSFASAIASSGSDYLIVWLGRDPGSDAGSSADHKLFGARVSDAGRVLDPEPIVISTGRNVGAPAVASNGSEYWVVWQESPEAGSSAVMGRRLGQDGAFLEEAPVEISSGPGFRSFSSIAGNGTGYLVVWGRDRRVDEDDLKWVREVFGARLTADGEVAGSGEFLLASGNTLFPQVASGDENYVVTWRREDGESNDLEVVRVLGSGEVDESSRGKISAGESAKSFSAIASDGAGYFAAWNDSVQDAPFGDVHGRVLSMNGEPESEPELISRGPNEQLAARVAATGDRFMTAWLDRRRGVTLADIYAAPVTRSGEALHATGIPVHVGAGQATAVAIAGRETEALVVWNFRERQGVVTGERSLLAARIAGDGTVLDAEPLTIATGLERGSVPAVAANADVYLAAWSTDFGGGRVWVGRIDPSGNVLDSGGIALNTESGHSPAVASDGSDFLVVWAEEGATSSIRGAVVSATGDVRHSAGFKIGDSARSFRGPKVAYGDGVYLVVWEGTAGIMAARIGTDGVVMEAEPVVMPQAANYFGGLHVASNGDLFLIQWRERLERGETDIQAAVVGFTPEVGIDRLAIDQEPGEQASTGIAAIGDTFLSVYTHRPDGATGRTHARTIRFPKQLLFVQPRFDGQDFVFEIVGSGSSESIVQVSPDLMIWFDAAEMGERRETERGSEFRDPGVILQHEQRFYRVLRK